MNGTTWLTPEGARRLRGRLEAFRARYREVCDDNPDALESGDTSGWHDNFAFEENQRQMHQLAHRVRELERVLDSAIVVRPPERPPARVVLGCRVVYRFDDEDADRTCTIAGWDDGDPAAGRISYNSPLGACLLGAAEGDVRELRAGERVRHVEIVELGPGGPEEEP